MVSSDDLAERMEVRVDRGRLTFVAALLLLSGAVCLFHYPAWHRSWFFGWLALALVPSVVSRRNDRRALLVLDDDGLEAPRLGLGVVAWSDVRRVHIQRVAHAKFLCVEIDGVDRYVARLSKWQAFLQTISLRRLGDELRIDLSFADAGPQDIFEEVSRRCEARRPDERPWN